MVSLATRQTPQTVPEEVQYRHSTVQGNNKLFRLASGGPFWAHFATEFAGNGHLVDAVGGLRQPWSSMKWRVHSTGQGNNKLFRVASGEPFGGHFCTVFLGKRPYSVQCAMLLLE